jgi:hypothetical protein
MVKMIRMPQFTAGLTVCIAFLSGFAAAQAPTNRAPLATSVVTLDGHSKGRKFDGLGAVSAGASSRLLIDYPEPYRSQILDYLFKPGYGAALQHLKVEIGSDVNSTDGSEPSHMRTPTDHDYTRGYEWWLMTEARKRNPKIILDSLPWGAPGWVGTDTLYTQPMADYVADFLLGAKDRVGLDIAYTGIWNEKQFDAGYVKMLHKSLASRYISTRIVCCDEYPGEGLGQWSIVEAIKKDAELARDVDVLTVHYPQDAKGKLTTTEDARKTGKPLWSSEDQPNSGGGPIVSREWTVGGRILANLYNRNYLEGAMTNTQVWSPVTSYYDILAAPNSGLMYANTPWSGHYDVQSTIWVTAHTTQFAQPGWQYLDTSSGYMPEKGTYVALKSPDNNDWSVVLETIGAKSRQTMNFKLQGGMSNGVVHIWETNGQRTFERVADTTPTNGTFTYNFEPDAIYSLTTTTGQGKGTALPPPQSGFPMPYHENFENTPITRAPRFLADQDGAFEAHPCVGRAGRCLEQVIVQKPIPWGPLPDPFTLAGDARWTDYHVKVDIHFLDKGPVTLMGRIDSADVFSDSKALWPSGYIFSLDSDGTWKLLSTAYKKMPVTLADGNVSLDRENWHTLEMSFQGDEIVILLNGKHLRTVHDGSHPSGMFGIGTGWQKAQFDNLSVFTR